MSAFERNSSNKWWCWVLTIDFLSNFFSGHWTSLICLAR